MTKVQDLAHFKRLLKEGRTDFAIAFIGGVISRKEIVARRDGTYRLLNGIDGSVEILSLPALLRTTNIGRALKRGAFYAE